MSKTMNAHANIRWKLLATVSVAALLSAIYSATTAQAADADRPQIWLELGGQLNRLDDSQEMFAPVFPTARPAMFEPSQKFERPPLYSFDENGLVSFQPENSDWIFSASLRYGRSSSNRNYHQQSYPATYFKYTASGGVGFQAQPVAAKFADTDARTSEKYLLLDFQAGKDVGLGMFGSSAISLGVRFAQFATKSNIVLKSDPDWHFNHKYLASQHKSIVLGQIYHSNAASANAARRFRGVGPSISWNASAPLIGNLQDSELSFDWGVNAAILFGKQRARVHHQTTSVYVPKYGPHVIQSHFSTNHTRSRSVIVPNMGGFAGLSFRYSDAKISLGYRADFFFGAMDGGIDARKSENRGFHGPFASISIGMGD